MPKQEENQSIHSVKHPAAKVIIGLGVIIAIGFVFLAYRRLDGLTFAPLGDLIQPTKAPEDVTRTDGGSLRLEYEQGHSVFAVGEDMTVILYANSVGQNVSGYDALLTYDATQLEFVSAESLVDSFNIFTNTDNDPVLVSGVRDFDNEATFIFDETPVAVLTFRALSEGAHPIDFSYVEDDTRDSNLVSMQTEDILSSVQGITLYAGNSTEAAVGETVELDDQASFTVQSISVPEDNCFDCPVTVNIRIQKGTDSEDVRFSLYGFDGALTQSTQALGYVIEVEDVTETSLQVRYAEEPLENETP